MSPGACKSAGYIVLRADERCGITFGSWAHGLFRVALYDVAAAVHQSYAEESMLEYICVSCEHLTPVLDYLLALDEHRDEYCCVYKYLSCLQALGITVGG